MNHSEIASFIWGVADLIRDTFKRGKYQDEAGDLANQLPTTQRGESEQRVLKEAGDGLLGYHHA